MREFKFRAWCSDNGDAPFMVYYDKKELDNGIWFACDGHTGEIHEIMQFTGFSDKNGDDVYEGDIFRIEEESDEGVEFIYVVVIWVQEWAMFTTLRIEDEYHAYLMEGVDAIDETMFWTYTLEDISSPKHFPCGNIYQNPELIKQ